MAVIKVFLAHNISTPIEISGLTDSQANDFILMFRRNSDDILPLEVNNIGISFFFVRREIAVVVRLPKS